MKRIDEFCKWLEKTFRDGFPNGTNYQRRECRKFKTFVEKQGDFYKVSMNVPYWTKNFEGDAIQEVNMRVHSLVNRKTGEIFKLRSDKVRGNIKKGQGFFHISWNRI